VTTTEQPIPHNDEAERALLGAVLIDPGQAPHLRDCVSSLYSRRNAVIAAAILSLHDAGQPCDILTIKRRLEQSGDLVRAGGPAYLAELLSEVPKSANAKTYADIVRNLGWRRGIAQRASTLAQSAVDGASTAALVDAIDGLRAGPGVPELGVPDLPEVLVPGSYEDAAKEYIEVGTDDYVAGVLRHLPPGTIYRRSGIPGMIAGEPGQMHWDELTVGHLRVLIDRHVRCIRWRKPAKEPVPIKTYEPSNRDLASIVLDQARVATTPAIRDLRLLVNYPVFIGAEVEPAEPGWNADAGIYYDRPPELERLAPICDQDRITALLDDLVVDFPFREQADKHNFFGLLLTPMLRPAIEGNVPMHLIGSSLERTGKTLLAEQVLGRIIAGRPTEAVQLSAREEERDKRILTVLLAGDTIVHIDNVREYLDSAALASLLTASTYSGRRLGATAILRLPNLLTLVATGNNVRATGELVKRTVPIRLQPTTDAPENRRGFAHPDLPEYLREVRAPVLCALWGMVERWREVRAIAPVPFGGFEAWARIVGGVMAFSGCVDWLANMRTWRRTADPHGEDLRAFVDLWEERYGSAEVDSTILLRMIDEAQLFGHALRQDTERGRLTALGQRILPALIDTPVGGVVIRTSRSKDRRMYYLGQETGTTEAGQGRGTSGTSGGLGGE